MSRPGQGEYMPRRQTRLILGPLFGTACFLATLTGVVVLAVLLGSVIAAAMRPPREPQDLAGKFREDGPPVAPRDQVEPVRQRGPAAPEAHHWYEIVANSRELGRFLWALATRPQSTDPALAGFRAGLLGSLWLLGLVAVFAIPTGIGAAVFLEEYVPPGRLRRIIQTNIANLAGVPSIVYGILGFALFVRAFGFSRLSMGRSLWAGGLTLGLLVLPVIVIATQEALRTVPSSLRQAALALGATKWQVVRDHVLPAALPGILTGAILALSRAIGETAPLLMVGAAGSIGRLPRTPWDRYTVLPVEIYNYAKEPKVDFQRVTAGGILILLILLLSMNATAIVIRNRTGRVPRG